MGLLRGVVAVLGLVACGDAANGTQLVDFVSATVSRPLAYGSAALVVDFLERAGLRANESALHVGGRKRHFGIPGGEVQFERGLGPERVQRLEARAASVWPHLPWQSLGFLHRYQYSTSVHSGLAQRGWAEEVSRPPHKPRRMADLQYFASSLRDDWANGTLPTNATVLDTGCGGGRNGLYLIEHLDPGNYFGFDRDEFSVRSFIQFELGVLFPDLLAAKEPTIRLEKEWDVFSVLRGAAPDLVLFASVLKKELGDDKRSLILHYVGKVLAPNGLVFVWSDCDDDLIALAATRRFALRFTHHHDCVFDRPTFHLSPAQVEAARGAQAALEAAAAAHAEAARFGAPSRRVAG